MGARPCTVNNLGIGKWVPTGIIGGAVNGATGITTSSSVMDNKFLRIWLYGKGGDDAEHPFVGKYSCLILYYIPVVIKDYSVKFVILAGR